MFKKKFSAEKAEIDALSRSQAIIHFTPDGIILDANQNFLNAVEYSLEEIQGKHHRMFCEPDYAQSDDYRQFWRRLAAGEFFSSQFKRITKSGKEVWIEASYNPVRNDKGDVVSIVKYATDITHQRLKFADYEGQLEAINRSQAVIQFNMDGAILTANENFCKTVGYTLEEIKGKHHRLFVDSDYAQSYEYQQFWARLNAGEHFVSEYQRFGKGGREIWLSASYNPILDMNGKPFKVVKYCTDITQQKNAAADAAGQIEAIGKSQAVIEFHPDGTIITANQNFLNAVGYSLAEIKGQHHRMFVEPAEANSEGYKTFWQRLARGEFDARVFKRVRKNGDDIWIQATYNPIFDAKGRPYKVVKYASDITPMIRIVEQTLSTTQSVAAAIEEMSASVAGISTNMTLSRQAAEGIIRDTGVSSDAAERLTQNMKTMESIVELINGIAGQVNLLALNATIEAARAGEAGKGFSVVAAEVKNLAIQTTKATEEISRQIQELQGVSVNVAESIKRIALSAQSVNQYVNGTAGALEEQNIATREISDNTQKMSIAVEDIARRIKGN